MFGLRSRVRVDEIWYENYYPEVKEQGLSPAEHYLKTGRKKGYFPTVKKLCRHYLKKESFPWRDFLRFYGGMFHFPGLPEPDYLSVAAIVRNEACYIKEWIEYHRLAGVSRFYIYDNESEDNLREVLQPYVDEGLVVLTDFPGRWRQMPAYNDALRRCRYKTRWLALIDADEFLVPVRDEDLVCFLKKYEKYPGVVVNWVLYDSGGHENRPEGLVIENYRTVHGTDHPRDHNVKSVVNPRRVKLCGSPHYCSYRRGCAVNENFEQVKGPSTAERSIAKIRLNHYFSKSYDEYLAKVSRGRISSLGQYRLNREDYLFPDAVEDYVMEKYAALLRSKV